MLLSQYHGFCVLRQDLLSGVMIALCFFQRATGATNQELNGSWQREGCEYCLLSGLRCPQATLVAVAISLKAITPSAAPRSVVESCFKRMFCQMADSYKPHLARIRSAPLITCRGRYLLLNPNLLRRSLIQSNRLRYTLLSPPFTTSYISLLTAYLTAIRTLA